MPSHLDNVQVVQDIRTLSTGTLANTFNETHFSIIEKYHREWIKWTEAQRVHYENWMSARDAFLKSKEYERMVTQ